MMSLLSVKMINLLTPLKSNKKLWLIYVNIWL